MPLSAPEMFGKYRILSQIGEGGMGVVYRAEVEGPGGPTPVVVKRVRPELARDPSFLRMMAQEARLGALMRHPCLVPVVETGEVTGAAGRELYLVLEYVDGYDLAQIVERAIRIGKQVPIGVACFIAQQAAEALDYAHTLVDERGKPIVIAHRDISPSNLMVTRDGAVKLLDFGIAKASEANREEHTRTGTMKGKFAYFSPEQAEGLPLDARSDLFSLGIVLMELILRRRLFRGNGDFDTLRRVREAEVPKPTSVRSDIDADLEKLLLRLMQRRREDRFASARALLDALRPIAQRYGASAAATRAYLTSISPIEHRSPMTVESEIVEPPENDDATAHVTPPPETTAVTEAAGRAKERRRGLFGRREPSDSVSKAPVEPPSRIAIVAADKMPRWDGPRWKGYLDSLPNGVQSFPECTIKAAIVVNFREHFGNPPMPDGAPKELHDFIANPPLVSSYVSGVLGRLFFLAIADELEIDDDTFIERAYAGNAKLLSSPLYKMLFTIMSTDRLIRNVKSRWGAFHHGIELDVPDFGKGYAHGILRWPPSFEPILVLRMHATGLRASLEAVGARNVRTQLKIVSAGEAHLDVMWDA